MIPSTWTRTKRPPLTDADWSLIVWALSKAVWADKAEADHALRLTDQIERMQRS